MSQEEKQQLIKNSDRSDTQKLSWKYFVVVPIMFIYYFSVGFSYYIQSEWIQHYIKTTAFKWINTNSTNACGNANHSDPDYITYEKVQESTAMWQSYCDIASTVPSFVATLLLPAYSDSFGRRFVFISVQLGAFIKFTVTALVIYYQWDPIYLVVASAVDGSFGSFSSSVAATSSYFADLTTSGNQRTLFLTSIDALLLIAITLSGLGIGFFVQYAGFLLPAIICAVMAFVILLATIFFLPETHDKKRRANVVSICDNFRRTVDFYGSQSFKGKRCAYILLLSAYFFETFSCGHRSAIEMIYQLGMPFCWTSESIGIFSAIRHAAQGFAGMVLVWPLKKCLSELSIAIISTVFNSGSYILEGFARKDLTLYLVAVPATLAFLGVPMIKSIMSSMTPADKQGSLFASILAVKSLVGVVTSYTLNTIYVHTVSIINGFVFFVLAGTSGIVFVILIIFAATQKVEKSEKMPVKIVNAEDDKHTEAQIISE